MISLTWAPLERYRNIDTTIWRPLGGGQRVYSEDEFLDRLTADEVLLQDAFEDFGSGRVIPDAVGIDHGDGSVLANPQAVGLGAINAAVRPGQLSLGESLLEVIPGGPGDFGRSAFGLGLFRAEENVALDLADTQVAGDFGEASSYFFWREN